MSDEELELLNAYEIREEICIDPGSMYAAPKFLHVRLLTSKKPVNGDGA